MQGQRFGDYLLETRIAAGGMGEVWRAQDVNLSRPVALKLLSQALASDPEFIARFVREAQTAAGLSHPAIATIYAVGEAHGRHFLAMELLPGETLDQRMAKDRVPPAKALSLAAQMADGLAAAHARGLVHRDIKPGNLMVLPDGRLKVLDFGLAKPETGALGGSATDGQMATRALVEGVTAAGVILGTVAYMSPEQARGEPLDRRSDIFSAGIVLYELLSGRHPYRAASAAQTLANLLHLRPTLPPVEAAATDTGELARITAKCLAHNRDDRYQHADELAVDLRAARRLFDESSGSRSLTGATAASSASRRSRSALGKMPGKIARSRGWLWGIAGLAAGFALTIAIFGIFGHGGRFLRSERPDVALVTRDASVQEAARLSPDGLTLVYQSDRAGPLKIFARGVGSTQTVQLTQGDDADTHPIYSPDGATIAYQRERRLDHGLEIRLVPALGGNSRKLFEGAHLRGFFPDGKALLISWCGKPCGLYRLSVEGGTPELTLELSGADYDEMRAAALTPDRQFLHFVINDFAERRGGLWEVELKKGAKPERLVPFRNDFGTAIGYGPQARRIYFSACNQQSSYANIYYYDRRAKQVRPVTGGANINIYPALSADGKQLVYTNWSESDQIGILPLVGSLADTLPVGDGRAKMISHGRLDDEQPVFSPDGSELAYVSDADGNYNLWIASLPAGERRQISFGKDANFSPLFSRDGKEVFYFSNHGGKTSIYRISTSGGQPRLLSDQVALPAYLSYAGSPSLSPDGTALLVGSPLPEGGFRVTRVEIASGKASAIGLATGMAPVFSADGKWIYAISRGPDAQARGDAAPFALWRYTLEGKAEKLHEFAEPVLDRYLAATADGKYLYYLAETFPESRERQVWRISLATLAVEPVTHISSPHPRFGMAVSRDGSQLAMSLNSVDSNIVLLDGMGE